MNKFYAESNIYNGNNFWINDWYYDWYLEIFDFDDTDKDFNYSVLILTFDGELFEGNLNLL